MIVDMVSDLHGFLPQLEGGDLLIIAGDLTSIDTQEQHMVFLSWIAQQRYKKKIWIAGNHDNYLIGTKFIPINDLGLEYLCDSGTEFENLRIWGSPWTKTFPGMNPHCKAFTVDTEEELAQKWKIIPDDVDILVTHSPPYGLRDRTIRGERVGSKSLQFEALRLNNLKLWVTAHIHEDYGIEPPGHLYDCHLINASHVNERYEPVNKPVRVIL